MRDRLRGALRRIVGDAQLEPRWLNTLSYLEYAGARKIMRTVASSHPSAQILEHAAETASHAATFKRLAADMVGGEPGDYVCRSAARDYVRKLDAELAAWATELVGSEHAMLNYLLVTAMFHRRAAFLYSNYRMVTDDERVRTHVGVIVGESERRGARVEADCLNLLAEYGVHSLSTPATVEGVYFSGFLAAVEAADASSG